MHASEYSVFCSTPATVQPKEDKQLNIVFEGKIVRDDFCLQKSRFRLNVNTDVFWNREKGSLKIFNIRS